MNSLIPGENIDAKQMRGTNKNHSGAWSAWVIHRLPDMRILHEAGLSGRNNVWGNVLEHSLVVNAAAVFLGEKLVQAGAEIDLATVDTASLLHDAAKRREKERGISYAQEHRRSMLQDMLYGAGYSPRVIAAARYTGRIPLISQDAREQEAALAIRPLEDLVVGYVDARTTNTDLVSLEEALDHNRAKVKADATFYEERWYPFYSLIEGRIMDSVRDPLFTPESINNDAVTSMVAAS